MSAEDPVVATPPETPAEVTESTTAEEPKKADSKPKSSSSKKAPASSSAKTAKPRASTAGNGNKKSNGSAQASTGDKKFEYGDIVLARLKGYPPWRESSDPKV